MRKLAPIRLGLFVLSAGALSLPAAEVQMDLVSQIAAAESARDSEVSEVSSVRRYTLHNTKWKADATMDVRMVGGSDGKKRYQILKMNAEGMQKQVFQRLLEGEVQSAEKGDQESAIIPSVYEMRALDRTGRGGCQMVELIPKKRTKYTIEGMACVDTKEKAVVYMEGRTARSVSFWVGRPYLTQEFRKVGAYWYSSRNKTVADVKMLGRTELTIDYVEYSVKPKKGALLLACSGACTPPGQ